MAALLDADDRAGAFGGGVTAGGGAGGGNVGIGAFVAPAKKDVVPLWSAAVQCISVQQTCNPSDITQIFPAVQ